MRALFLLLSLVLVPGLVVALEPGPLPALTLRDNKGALVSAGALQTPGKWVMVVIDSALPAAYDMLNGLSAKEASAETGLTLAVIGSEADLLRLQQEFEKLSQARWLLSRDTTVIQDLRLPGIPAMIGMEGEQVSWQYIGIPDAPEKAQSMVQEWLAR